MQVPNGVRQRFWRHWPLYAHVIIHRQRSERRDIEDGWRAIWTNIEVDRRAWRPPDGVVHSLEGVGKGLRGEHAQRRDPQSARERAGLSHDRRSLFEDAAVVCT